MKKCTELLKNGNQSLVEIRETDTDKVEKYVVCQGFDNSKAYGSKWNTGRYFDVWGNTLTEENQMKAAALYLYGMGGTDISYQRLTDLAKVFVTQLREYISDDEDFADVLKDEADITEDEADFFGIKSIVFPKLFKVINATYKREQFLTIQVVVPNDASEWNVDDYVENKEYFEDCADIESEDWEYDDYGVEEEDITEEDFKSRYSSDTVWNADDIDDLY